MAKITKRIVDAAGPREKDYVIWDDVATWFWSPRIHLR